MSFPSEGDFFPKPFQYNVFVLNPTPLPNYCCILICRCMQNHNDDTIIRTGDTDLRKIYLSLYLKGMYVRGSWRPNRTATY